MPLDINLIRHIKLITNSSTGTVDIDYYHDTFSIPRDFDLPDGESLNKTGYNKRNIIVSSGDVGREYKLDIQTTTGSTKPKLFALGAVSKFYRIDTTDASDMLVAETLPYLEVSSGYYLEVSSGYKLRVS